MNDSNTTTRDPAAIEQDIRRTQEDMSRTVDQIGDQLTLKNVFNALLDKADDNGVDAHYLVEGARRNPMALGLIAAGAIWLVSDKNAKFPSFGSGKSGKSDGSGDLDLDGRDVHHRDYVAHMAAIELRDDEDHTAYQRRRDIARSNFFMCERKPDEDDHSFRQRLDDLSDKFREKRRAWSDTASQAGSATGQTAKQAASKAQDMFFSNPMVGGMLAAAVGAALGSSLPVSRQEQEKLGSLGSKVRDAASEKKDEMTSKLREKKDEMVEKADDKLQQSGGQGQSGQSWSPTSETTHSGTSQVGSDEPASGRSQPSFDRTTT